jgi:hypothetical protein
MPFGTRPVRPWTEGDDARLRTMIAQGMEVPALAVVLGRTKAAIISRKGRLGLSLRDPV